MERYEFTITGTENPPGGIPAIESAVAPLGLRWCAATVISERRDKNGRRMFTLTIPTEIDLSADEIWPDGPPDDPTVDDVAAEIRKSSRFTDWVDDWNMDYCGLSVMVSCGVDTAEVEW